MLNTEACYFEAFAESQLITGELVNVSISIFSVKILERCRHESQKGKRRNRPMSQRHLRRGITKALARASARGTRKCRQREERPCDSLLSSPCTLGTWYAAGFRVSQCHHALMSRPPISVTTTTPQPQSQPQSQPQPPPLPQQLPPKPPPHSSLLP